MGKDMNVNFRLSPDTATILAMLAARKGISEAMVLEQLVRCEARETAVINAAHPEAAFESLLNSIQGFPVSAHQDFTFEVFKLIKADPVVKGIYDKAIVPLPGQSAVKRAWHVNQTIGRLCKRLTGWESGEQIAVPKGECDLIKTFTRLKPPVEVKDKPTEVTEMLDEAKQTFEKLDLVIGEVTLVRR